MSKETAMALVAPKTETPATPLTQGLAPVDPAAAPVTPPAEPESARFAHFAKREAKLVKDRQELAAEKERARAEIDKFKRFDELKTQNKVEALKLIGFTDTDILNLFADTDKPEPTDAEKAIEAAKQVARDEIKTAEDKRVERETKERAQRDNEQIAGFKSDIGKTVEADTVKFKHCAFHGESAQELIYQVVLATLKDTQGKELLTADEAAVKVEEYYREQFKLAQESLKEEAETAQEDAVSKDERTRTVTPGFPAQEQPKPAITKTRTLSNAATSTSTAALQRRVETREQKRERLMEALKAGKTG